MFPRTGNALARALADRTKQRGFMSPRPEPKPDLADRIINNPNYRDMIDNGRRHLQQRQPQQSVQSAGRVINPPPVDQGMAMRPPAQATQPMGRAPDGTPVIGANATVDRIIQHESGGRPDAKNPRSSASGYGQFIDSTWLSTVRKHRPDLASRSDAELLGLKTDPVLGRQMTEAHTNDNAGILRGQGIEANDRNLYLMHFLGGGAAPNVINADPSAPISNYVTSGAISANPTVLGGNKTVGDVLAWAGRSMGGRAPEPSAAVASAPTPSGAYPPIPPDPSQPGTKPEPAGLFGLDKQKLQDNMAQWLESMGEQQPYMPRSRAQTPQNTFISSQSVPWLAGYRG